MRKLGLFFTLLISVFLLGTATNVSADTFDETNTSKINGNYLPDYYLVNAGQHRSFTLRVEDWQLRSQQPFYANFLYLKVCATQDFYVYSQASCTTGCINSEIYVASAGGSCAIGNGTYGKNYYIFYSVDSWAMTNYDTVPYIQDNLTIYHDYNNYIAVRFNENFITNENTYIDFASNGKIEDLQKETNSKLDGINSSINNQTSAINNQTSAINNQTNTISDSTISTTSSSSFFSNFSTSDNGGISSVITAPLSFVRAMTNSCSPISFTIFEQEISLPCGTTLFWDKEEVQPFRDVWNVLVGGAFVYMLLRKVFMTIEDMKDPESDKVSVIKL